jgi:aminomethyltransferase
VTGTAEGGGSRETPLLDRHRAAGARLIDFAGWLMPVSYAGIIDEHRAVRERAGLFDLSHMGELFVDGPDAGSALARALVTDPRALTPGRAHYSMICAEDGGVIDDLIVYRLAEDGFMVVANASNAEAVSDALSERLDGARAVLDDRSAATALVAIQGPRSIEILGLLASVDLGTIRYYGIAAASVAGVDALVARTGYTGEDGFEVFVDWARAPDIWDAIAAAGAQHGLVPVGLGARDTLRLEAGMPLYGNELDRDTNPFEAGQGRIVRFDKEEPFIGRAALEQAALAPPARRLVGLAVRGRGIARGGYPVMRDQRRTGTVTSGAPSPSLGMPIAMAYVTSGDHEPGTMLDVVVRDQRVAAEVVPLPFYRRSR